MVPSARNPKPTVGLSVRDEGQGAQHQTLYY